MSTEADEILDLEAFEAWLAEQPARRYVGEVAIPDACPLATFLHARGYPDATVGIRLFSPTGDSENLTAPDWARAFVAEVDRVAANRITAARARKALAAAKVRVAGLPGLEESTLA